MTDEDKACCRLQRQLRASMAAKRRLLMGPNEKLLKHVRGHEEAHHNLCILADARKKLQDSSAI